MSRINRQICYLIGTVLEKSVTSSNAIQKKILDWPSQSSYTISMNCVPNTFQHIGFSTNARSSPQTPYSAISFPYLDNSDCKSVDSNDVIKFE